MKHLALAAALAVLPALAWGQTYPFPNAPYAGEKGTGAPSTSDQILVQQGVNSHDPVGSPARMTLGTLQGLIGGLPLSGGTLTGALTAPGITSTGTIAGNVTATGGTTGLSLSDWFAQVVNVKAFGAKGDGVTDDTAAINRAVATIPNAGAVVLFPAGNYLVSGPVILPSNTTVSGAGAVITAAPAASWPNGQIKVFFGSVLSAANITIENLWFSWPHGNANYGVAGAYAHIIDIEGATGVVIRNNVSDGGGDFSALVGDANTLETNNTVTNISNSCFDHWNGAIDARVTDNYCTTWSGAGAAVGAIQFTGIATGGGAANTSGLIATGNIIYVNNNNAQAIMINGHATGGSDNKFIVANNKIFVNGVSAWGVLVLGQANNGIITGNYLEGGVTTTGAFGAVSVASPATNVIVEANIAVNWQAGAQGVFNNNGSGGILADNQAYGSSTPTIGTNSSTTQVHGNDAGTGTLNLDKVNITSGSGKFNGPLSSVIGPIWGWNGGGGLSETINAASGVARNVVIQSGGINRWAFGATNVVESGGNAGSDYVIQRYSDTGTLLGPALTINRATGIVSYSAANGITAAAGGGQTNATLLTAYTNRVAVVASAADSIKLPPSVPGMCIEATDAAANAMQAFGSGTDTINDVATATGVSVAAGKTGHWCSPVAGKWYGGTLN